MSILRFLALGLVCAIFEPLMKLTELALRWPLPAAVLIVAAAVFASGALGAASCLPGVVT